MAQNTDEMASIVIGDDRDECITYTPANDHYRQKSPDTVVGSTGGREEHACGHRNRYRCGDGKSNPQDESGDPSRDDRHDAVAGQFFHEQVQEARLPLLQTHGRSAAIPRRQFRLTWATNEHWSLWNLGQRASPQWKAPNM